MQALRHFLNQIAKRVAALGIASRSLIERFLEYGISTGISTGLEFLILFLLVDAAGWHYLSAVVVAFFVKVTFLFWLASYTAFRDQQVQKSKAYLKFFGIYLVNLCIILVFMKIAVDEIGMNYLLARGITLSFMVFWSFWLNAKYNFKLLK